MKPALLLVDLQNDFLATPGLEPPPNEVTERAARLLDGCRELGVPAIHVQTTISPDGHDRMPHWRREDRWQCVAGTPGHEPPEALRPRDEPMVDKTWFSAFSNSKLDGLLGALGTEELVLCGVHLHGCVRTTAIDAYQRGLEVWIASDAVGSYDPLHAEVTRRYLEGRAATFATVDALLERLAKSRSSARRRESGSSAETG